MFNQKLHAPSNSFVETNGVISIPASQYIQKEVGSVASWRTVTGLGRSGLAMPLEPMNGWYVEDLMQVRQESPALKYEIVVTEGGPAKVIVEAVPAFPLNEYQQLRCAISIGYEEPQWVTFEMGQEGAQSWQDNVLDSRMIGTEQLDLEPGNYRFKLWGTDPSANVEKIMIDFGGLKPSYVGPSLTKVSHDHMKK